MIESANGVLTSRERINALSDFKILQRRIHACALEKGWYDPPKTLPESIALMHSELSEALEEYRDGKESFYLADGKPEGIAAEFADVIIRILDTAQYLGLDIGEALLRKHDYNLTRPHRHGDKKV